MTHFAINLIAAAGYWGIALLMCLENICPPIPSELIMGLGGIAVAHGRMHFVPLLIAGACGSTAGTTFWYLVGRFLGKERLKPVVDRWGRWLTLEWEDVERLEAFFVRHGGWVVFVFRFMPTARTLISLPAGLLRMPLPRFLLWTLAGTAVWDGLLIGAGYWLGSNFRKLDEVVAPIALILIGAVAIAYVWRILTWKPRALR